MNAQAWLPRVGLAAVLVAAALWRSVARLDLAGVEAGLPRPRRLGAGLIRCELRARHGSLRSRLALRPRRRGPVRARLGAIWSLVGATLGAMLAFLAARYVASDWTARRAGGRLTQLVEGVEAEGWRFVALTRLVPLVPFNLLNYALGLTRIRLTHYTIATAVCMHPGAAAYAWLGYAGREAAAGSKAALGYGALGLALLALVIFLPRLVRRFRRGAPQWISTAELKRRLDAGSALTVVDVRSPEEFGGPLAHIHGARNLPLSDFARVPNELAGPGGRPIVLVCRTHMRSARAAEALRSAGFRDVLILRGGMLQWQRDAAGDVRAPAPIGGKT